MRIAGERRLERTGGLRSGHCQEPVVLRELPVGEVLARERRKSQLRTPTLTPDIVFLARCGIPEGILKSAAALAAVRRTEAREELFAAGFSRRRYWEMLADDLGLQFADDLSGAEILNSPAGATVDAVRAASSLLVRRQGKTLLLHAPGRDAIEPLRRRLRQAPALAERVRICPPETIRAMLVSRRQAALNHYAVNRLARVLPSLSASRLGAGRGRQASVNLFCAGLGLCLADPFDVAVPALLICTIFFSNCAAWKIAAAFSVPKSPRLQPLASRHLPTYTILVPLYREAAVVPDLMRRLGALDYPQSKLQILILLEPDDADSRAAVSRAASSAVFEVLIVPPGGPRTKPKALAYAMPFARGEMVVVYDAEDRPEPDQLRKAAAAFRERPALGCVQARLAPDNEDSWFARMFALEYAANFEIVLPALASFGVPLPLGGTSNHFPRTVLEKVGAWDPYNVTEDADLGVRLARFGYQTATIVSRTFEEAPVTFRQWLPQRRRWVKGWIQTSLLGLASQASPSLRLSRRKGLAVHAFITAGVVGLLLYPASMLAIAWSAFTLMRGEWPEGLLSWLILWLTAFNIGAILLAAFVSSFRGLRARGALHLAPLIPLLPVYWGFMSYAAWGALFQFLKDPCRWEKTTHGVARRRTPAYALRLA